MMDLLWLCAILLGAALGYYISTKRHRIFVPSSKSVAESSGNKKTKSKEPLEIEKLTDSRKRFKMVLVARNDLKMGKGKIAAQCSLPLILLVKVFSSLAKIDLLLDRWENCAQPKVVVKIESEEEMLALRERAKSLKLPTHITIDAGKTQIAPDSRTVMAILGPVDVVDDVTGGLKLM
ncbi:hypothetical protein Bca4012_069353 [Brassica carinata]